MAAKSLQQHIQRLIGFTLLVVSLAILLAVWFSTGGHVRTQISNDLEVGHSVLTQLLETREQQLLNSAEVLTADFGFKQAVASGDAATAQSALDNHGERIQADLMALLSLDGTVTVTTRSALVTGQAFPAMKGLLTQVLVKQQGKWLISAQRMMVPLNFKQEGK